MKLNILFLGKFFPKNLVKTIVVDSKGKMGMSNHNFEMSILNGLCKQDSIDLQCITIPAVYSFPYNNRKFYTKSESYDYDNTRINSVGFCNLVLVKEWWSIITCAVQIIKSAQSFKGEQIHVLINTPNERLFHALQIAKWFIRKRFTKTIIIPDIPAMVTAMDKQNPIKNFLLKKSNNYVMRQTSKSDGLVLLTEAMMDFISRPVAHIVMEGVVDVDTMSVYIEEEQTPLNKQIILYTGTLRRIFGVMNLLQAFQNLPNQDVELWICGSGDSKDAIEAAAKQDSRIKFWGLVDSKTALKMQHQATILVNPRTSNGAYTKYSFPSKTMEYLLAGKSVIINRLPGIPDEYYNYVYTPKDETVASFTECMYEVLTMDKNVREKRARAGKDFITQQKNSIVQMKRVIDLISSYR